MGVRRFYAVGVFLFVLVGCASTQSTKTSLELQAIQAREFETSKKIAFASVVSVFQDLGYIIESADFDTGFITANSPDRTRFVPFVGNVIDHTEATAFVEQMRESVTKVRLNFVNCHESSSGYGQKSSKEEPIEDPAIYENAFVKIQEAIFIRTETM